VELLLAQVEPTIWKANAGTTELYVRLFIGALLGVGMIVAFMFAPTRARRYIVGVFTFLAGLIFVLKYFWPEVPGRAGPEELPKNFTESGAFMLEDVVTMVGEFSNILTGFLLGLGIYSLVRIHSTRLIKKHKDWFFSLTLLLSLVVIAVIGLTAWVQTLDPVNGPKLADPVNWGFFQRAQDLLFDGLLQEMDAAFFSIIAFYILSAAYRAFRIRSIEATILLATALIVMVSLMGAVEFKWGEAIKGVTDNNADHFLNNFTLTSIRDWLRDSVQTPGLRAIQFGIGIGALAMGLRLWLSLERGGVRS
jgi:hypothetical protein